MKREEQIKEYISTFIEQYAESVDCHPEEIEHFGFFIRMGINWAERHPKGEVDWHQVRRQAAIAAMQGMCASKSFFLLTNECVPQIAVKYADALVKELKGE
jgi:hypothetical protein